MRELSRDLRNLFHQTVAERDGLQAHAQHSVIRDTELIFIGLDPGIWNLADLRMRLRGDEGGQIAHAVTFSRLIEYLNPVVPARRILQSELDATNRILNVNKRSCLASGAMHG